MRDAHGERGRELCAPCLHPCRAPIPARPAQTPLLQPWHPALPCPGPLPRLSLLLSRHRCRPHPAPQGRSTSRSGQASPGPLWRGCPQGNGQAEPFGGMAVTQRRGHRPQGAAPPGDRGWKSGARRCPSAGTCSSLLPAGIGTLGNGARSQPRPLATRSAPRGMVAAPTTPSPSPAGGCSGGAGGRAGALGRTRAVGRGRRHHGGLRAALGHLGGGQRGPFSHQQGFGTGARPAWQGDPWPCRGGGWQCHGPAAL